MMELEIKFPHLDKPAAMEELVQKKFNAIARRLDARYSIGAVNVIADVTQRKPDGRPEKFSVMIMVDCVKPRRRVVAKKSASDFKKALNEALVAMEKILRRESELSERARKMLGHKHKSVRDVKRSYGTSNDSGDDEDVT
jgi:ribosome-associated translation inhibitor RaiA